jgi:cytochrome c oxidase accessory protein FixG
MPDGSDGGGFMARGAASGPAGGEMVSAALPRDGRRHAFQPADVRGPYDRARRVVFALLIALWAALPWVNVGGHPALFVDVETKELFLFGLTYGPQDTWLLFFLLTGVGFGLVYATALAGRVWCGWACPQTVFLEGVYRRIERWIEGPREKRTRRNAGPWTADKALRKSATQAAYAAVSLVIAHIVLSYFVSLPKTFAMVRQSPSAHPEAFVWMAATTAVLYLNFAWFREQLCVVMCPYGRLQGVMLDANSLVVGYDARRGEPRGKKGAAGAGDCVDCKRCVAVCPTGIDIRNGVQLECVGCTACIDACDDIMVRLDRPRGLIRYDSQNGLAGKPTRIVRPRVLAYSVLMVVGAVVAFVATRKHLDYEVTFLRLPGAPYTADAARVTDPVQLHIVNKLAQDQRYRIEIEPVDGLDAVVPMPVVAVPSLGDVRVPVFLSMPREGFHREFPVRVRVAREGATTPPVVVSGTFLGPRS